MGHLMLTNLSVNVARQGNARLGTAMVATLLWTSFRQKDQVEVIMTLCTTTSTALCIGTQLPRVVLSKATLWIRTSLTSIFAELRQTTPWCEQVHIWVVAFTVTTSVPLSALAPEGHFLTA